MLSDEDYAAQDAVGLAALIARGEVTAAEALEAAIRRAEATAPTVNALSQRLYDRARAEVAAGLPGVAADAPLRGVPYLLKDIGADLAGTTTGAGLRTFDPPPAAADTTLTARLRAAGLVIFGRTTTPELGLAASTETTRHGDVRNPWNLGHTAGGSSGGAAAAVAAGVVPAAHASDGGGSIRIPASMCGLVGLKPTRGRVPSGPPAGEGWGGLSVAHAVTRTVRDTALLLDVAAGPSPGDPYAAPAPARPYAAEVGAAPGRLRVALLTRPLSGAAVDPACAAAAKAAAALLADLGHEVVEAAVPGDWPGDWAEVGLALWTVVAANTADAVHALAAAQGRTPRPSDVEAVTWGAVEFAGGLPARAYPAAIGVLHRFGRRMAALHAQADLLVSPTLAMPPPPLGLQRMDAADLDAYAAVIARLVGFTQPCNISGQPAISVPFAMAGGLPVGVQIAAPFGREDLLIRVAAQIEAARPWPGRAPSGGRE